MCHSVVTNFYVQTRDHFGVLKLTQFVQSSCARGHTFMITFPADPEQRLLGHDGFLQQLGSFGPFLAKVRAHAAVIYEIVGRQQGLRSRAADSRGRRSQLARRAENKRERHVYREAARMQRHGSEDEPRQLRRRRGGEKRRRDHTEIFGEESFLSRQEKLKQFLNSFFKTQK